MEEPILEAKGTNGQVELLQDRIRIRRKGLFGKGIGGDHDIPYQQLTSIKFKSGWMTGYIYFVVRDQEDNQHPKYEVRFDPKNQQEHFEGIKRVLEQRLEGGQGPVEMPQAPEPPKVHPQETSEETTPWEDADHSLDLALEGLGSLTLGGRVKKYVERNINPGESVEFFIVGQDQQSIVALQDRLLVVKCGMFAGATFGGRVTSFYYRDINGIEVNTGLIYAVIEVNSPSYQGTQGRDFWNLGSNKSGDNSPFVVSNCIPIDKWSLKKQKPQLDRLRAKITEAKQERTAPNPTAFTSSGSGISAELERLAALRQSGALTDEEFQQAKKKLLS